LGFPPKIGLGNARCDSLIRILVLKQQYLSRSARLDFGLKPDPKTKSYPGAKAPGY